MNEEVITSYVYRPQVGDVHISFKNGVYLIWEYTNPRSGLWIPIDSTRHDDMITEYLATNNLVKIKETRDGAEFDQMPSHCGIYRHPPVICCVCHQELPPENTFEYNERVYCAYDLPAYDRHQQW
jgi:hypothetical protein